MTLKCLRKSPYVDVCGDLIYSFVTLSPSLPPPLCPNVTRIPKAAGSPPRVWEPGALGGAGTTYVRVGVPASGDVGDSPWLEGVTPGRPPIPPIPCDCAVGGGVNEWTPALRWDRCRPHRDGDIPVIGDVRHDLIAIGLMEYRCLRLNRKSMVNIADGGEQPSRRGTPGPLRDASREKGGAARQGVGGGAPAGAVVHHTHREGERREVRLNRGGLGEGEP